MVKPSTIMQSVLTNCKSIITVNCGWKIKDLFAKWNICHLDLISHILNIPTHRALTRLLLHLPIHRNIST